MKTCERCLKAFEEEYKEEIVYRSTNADKVVGSDTLE